MNNNSSDEKVQSFYVWFHQWNTKPNAMGAESGHPSDYPQNKSQQSQHRVYA